LSSFGFSYFVSLRFPPLMMGMGFVVMVDFRFLDRRSPNHNTYFHK